MAINPNHNENPKTGWAKSTKSPSSCSKVAIDKISECFNKLPKPDPNELHRVLGLSFATDEVPIKIFTFYQAAYKIRGCTR